MGISHLKINFYHRSIGEPNEKRYIGNSAVWNACEACNLGGILIRVHTVVNSINEIDCEKCLRAKLTPIEKGTGIPNELF